METIIGMGFTEDQARLALEACGGDLESALDALLSGRPLIHEKPPTPMTRTTTMTTSWTCAFCTFENTLESAVCSMCGGIPGEPISGTTDEGSRRPVSFEGESPDDSPFEGGEGEGEEPPLETRFPPPMNRRKGGEGEGESAKGKEEPEGPTQDEKAPEELKEAIARLKAFFLGPGSSTDGRRTGQEHLPKLRMATDSEIRGMMRESVPGVDKMMDRRKTTPVIELIISTHRSGLPLYERMPAVQRHIVEAMRFTMSALLLQQHGKAAGTAATGAGAGAGARGRHLQRLADAFTSCQAEQVRVIDAVFGAVSGRDRGLREQVLAIADDQKQRVLDQVTHVLHPRAWRQDDSSPTDQVPHIQSAYRREVGRQLGLRAVDAASADPSSRKIGGGERARVLELFPKLFQVDELVTTIVEDVNQQSPTADRLISREELTRWAGDTATNKGFESHSIYWDEDRAKDFPDGAKPDEKNQFQPFLCKRVVIDILLKLFL